MVICCVRFEGTMDSHPNAQSSVTNLASKLSYPLPIHLFDTTEDIGIIKPSGDVYFPLLRRVEKVGVGLATGLFVAKALGDASSSQFSLLQELIFDGPQIAYLPRSPFPASLKFLTLLECGFRWSWLQLDHLTDLRVDVTNPDDQIGVPEFIGYMLNLPNLFYLQVANLLRPTSPSTSVPGAVNLRRDRACPQLFLSSIRFEPDFTLTVELLDHGDMNEGQSFLESLVPHLHTSRHVIRRAVLDCGDRMGQIRILRPCRRGRELTTYSGGN
ncbi:hypothetical protein BDN72DRAFT_965459 [Pluteus cervinus]|uniref:Uncharacterized protein n=1 Tax=Pluteus cervinus TaxID=181527 RepID=A0ACD3A5N8_9AGAR|nr:hypothetical protein BDN72DRAFT_965459 [Pluteus cervinus]